MKKFMKKLAKKAEGFTLVELVVVIAILGILAGVAVPAYSGYLEKANDAAVVVELDAIKTAILTANAKAGGVDSIAIDDDGETITITSTGNLADDFLSNFKMFYDKDAELTGKVLTLSAPIDLDKSSYNDGTTWNGTSWS